MSFREFIILLCLAAATQWCVADEVLYRYEGEVFPYHESAGWSIFDPCDGPCSESVEDGHFVLQWAYGGDIVNYHHWIAQPPVEPPPTLWVEWRFRSNHPISPFFYTCDGWFTVHYGGMLEVVFMFGDAAVSFSGGDAVFGLNINEFHTYRFESLDGVNYRISVDGLVFIVAVDSDPSAYHYLQFGGEGGCDFDLLPTFNEWDFVRYGTIDSGERIVSTDPSSGTVSPGVLSALDTFTATFDAANYVYIHEITVTSTGGVAPTVIATRRRELDEPDTVEIVLDQPPPPGEITRFIFDDGEAINIIEFADFPIGQGACCLNDGSCQDLTEQACATLSGAVFRGAGTTCLGDNDGNSVDDACDDLGLCPTGANCGDGPTECSGQDTCDGSGNCSNLNPLPVDTPCGEGGTECSNQDTCDGAGNCSVANHKADGTLCGDPPAECTDHDTCVSGICRTGSLFACGLTDGCCPPGCGPRDHDLDCGEPVPTVSGWGLMILALLLLVAMKVHFGRPPEVVR